MILESARVLKYKNITDSGEIRFERKVTCLVGKNESGKTALMEALYRLNPAATGYQYQFRPLHDYPRTLYTAERASAEEVRPITAVFGLEAADIEAVESQFGKGVLTRPTVQVEKSYANTSHWTIDVDEGAAVRHFASGLGLDRLALSAGDLGAFKARLESLPPSKDPTKAEAIAALTAKLASLDLQREIRSILSSRLPTFVYFDEYSTLVGRASIPRLQHFPPDQLKPSERTALSLLRLAGAEAVEFGATEYEARKAALEAAANHVSDEVFAYWSQNLDLAVQLDVDFKTMRDSAGEPPYLEVRIHNRRHRVSLNVGESSAGFSFFFSFVAAFSEYRSRGDRLILLMDEPMLGLHAEAQKDLLRYIDEQLAPKQQVIYSTHSPFMIKADDLQRIRTVEDLNGKGTTVGDDIFCASKETINPIQGALGYDLVQTLLAGPHNLVVEGASDYLYLQTMSGHLRTLKRAHLDPRWVIVPLAGLEKLPTLVALLGSRLRAAVLVNSDGGGSQRLTSMIDHHLLDPNRLLTVASITKTAEADIEDLFDPTFYVDLVDASGAARVTASHLTRKESITKRIERAVGHKYDRYAPARYFLENQVWILPELDQATIDRFAELFDRLNALLPVAT